MESWCDLWKETLYILLIGCSALLLGVGIYVPFGRRCGACEMRDTRRGASLLVFCVCVRCMRKSYLLEIGMIFFGTERYKCNRTFDFSNASSIYY